MTTLEKLEERVYHGLKELREPSDVKEFLNELPDFFKFFPASKLSKKRVR